MEPPDLAAGSRAKKDVDGPLVVYPDRAAALRANRDDDGPLVVGGHRRDRLRGRRRDRGDLPLRRHRVAHGGAERPGQSASERAALGHALPPPHYELPDFLQALTQTEPRLTILRPKYDYGPVDKILYALERESGPSTHLIYLDDDVLYHPDLVRLLVSKSREYPASVVALSGCTLRSHFRQIRHRLPRARYDVPPNLYYPLSGTASLPHDETVDIVQGFAGVLVRPAFFDLPAFVALVQTVTLDHDIWKADDFIISAHLASRNITRRLVAGTAVTRIHAAAATVDNVSSKMHRQILQAAVALQRRLGIWSGHAFVDYLALDDYWKDLLDCEAGHALQCERAAAADSESMMTPEIATWLLDKKFVPRPPP